MPRPMEWCFILDALCPNAYARAVRHGLKDIGISGVMPKTALSRTRCQEPCGIGVGLLRGRHNSSPWEDASSRVARRELLWPKASYQPSRGLGGKSSP